MYMIILLIVLGFDEFLHVITSPVLLILTIMIGVSLYVVYLLNLGGPAKQIATTVLSTSVSGLQSFIADQMANHSQEQQRVQQQQQQQQASSKKND